MLFIPGQTIVTLPGKKLIKKCKSKRASLFRLALLVMVPAQAYAAKARSLELVSCQQPDVTMTLHSKAIVEEAATRQVAGVKQVRVKETILVRMIEDVEHFDAEQELVAFNMRNLYVASHGQILQP